MEKVRKRTAWSAVSFFVYLTLILVSIYLPIPGDHGDEIIVIIVNWTFTVSMFGFMLKQVYDVVDGNLNHRELVAQATKINSPK